MQHSYFCILKYSLNIKIKCKKIENIFLNQSMFYFNLLFYVGNSYTFNIFKLSFVFKR